MFTRAGTTAVRIDETVGPEVGNMWRHPLLPEDQDPSCFRKCKPIRLTSETHMPTAKLPLNAQSILSRPRPMHKILLPVQ